jgi:phenylpyruvate tautomerase PptA (4-oxalocrotonate tautomerase family)
MPLVMISIVKGRTSADKRSLSDAIHEALVEAFRIPENDYNHRIAEYPPEDFLRPHAGPESAVGFVLVEITVFPGRSREAKKRLYRGIVERLGRLGTAPGDVMIVLREPPLVNWGVRGGIPGDEADLGFRLDV